MGVMTLLVLAFPFARAKGNAGTGSGLLLAVNQGEATLGIVDPQAGKQVAVIAEGGVTGHEVAVSLDGKTIYGDSSVGEAGTDGRDMVAIDIASRKVVGHLDYRVSFSNKVPRRSMTTAKAAVLDTKGGVRLPTTFSKVGKTRPPSS
jgi:hypothetical protein